MKRQSLFLILFIISGTAELLALLVQWREIHLIAKPLILLFLIGYYLARVSVRSDIFIRGLFFCWAGDILLLFSTEDKVFFISGLFAFLIGHVLYIFTYRRHRSFDAGSGLLGTQKVRFSLPFILAATGLVVVLYPRLGDLRIPVLIYALVIMLMAMNALFRYGHTTSRSFWMVFVGALLFMTSDSLLAINRFFQPFPFAESCIMITYITAQFLIVEGLINHR